MEKILFMILAVGALIGGIDRLFSNRFGLGARFEEAVRLIGPTALSMAGILCLEPVLARGLRTAVSPLFERARLDPSLAAGLLAIDMGGYPLAADLAHSPAAVRFSGLLVAATLGCTLTFTIPVGMGMLHGQARRDFSTGMLYGLAALPLALVPGGFMCGLRAGELAALVAPVTAFSALLAVGLRLRPGLMVRLFSAFARLLQIAGTVGLALGAFRSLAQVGFLDFLAPIEDGMATAAAIGVAMMGSLPISELLMRALSKPLAALGRHTGMNDAGVAGLLIGTVSVMPAIAMIEQMDSRSRIVNAACMVCAASTLAAHLGYASRVDAPAVPALIACKLLGGALAAALALALTRKGGDKV